MLATLPVPLIVSVAGFSHDEFATLVQAVAERGEVAALELNVSCPNVKSGCIVGSEAGEMGALMRRVRPLTAKPLIVKLTPNVSEIGPVARAAQDGGADALSLINTLRAAAVDPVSGAPWLGAGSGGLSGPAVRPVALALTAEVAAATELPLVGMGGIQEGRHALDFIAAGSVVRRRRDGELSRPDGRRASARRARARVATSLAAPACTTHASVTRLAKHVLESREMQRKPAFMNARVSRLQRSRRVCIYLRQFFFSGRLHAAGPCV